MQQAADLLELIEELRNRDRRLTFGLFTGYTEHELASGRYFCISRHPSRRGATCGSGFGSAWLSRLWGGIISAGLRLPPYSRARIQDFGCWCSATPSAPSVPFR